MALNIKATLFALSCCFSLASYAFQEEKTEIEYYNQDNVTNRIPYFDNRFHLDAQLDEITLLFYRRSGSPPIILVRPDGSKLKINNLPKDRVEWYDDKTFDMIRIKKPMPGPWQAVGEILPHSKIMIVSEVSLEVEPLDEILLSGETIKVKGQIYNREKVVDDPLFNDVINLKVDFFSTNNTAYDNFGAEPLEMGAFRDDGYDLDEYARDGIFTAEFQLDFSPGEWIPVYKVIMPMATRELRQKPVILQANPITIEVKTTVEPLEFHKVTIHIDETHVDPDSLIFQGKIIYPDRTSEPFAIMEGKGITRKKEIGYTESGVHRIQLNAFGRTKSDREFRLIVPDFTFNVERKGGLLVPGLEQEDNVLSQAEIEAQQLAAKLEAEKLAREQAMEEERLRLIQEAEERAQRNLIIIIVAIVLLVISAAAFVFIMRRKSSKTA
jgi:uncharacterized protein (TIGR03503 family)